MAKTHDISSASSVTTEEGSNYAGQQGGFSGGLKESDKQYLSTLLSSAQSSGRRSSEAHQAKSPVVGNYYGSMIGNVPLFARQGVTLPVDTIDDMYQKDQLRRLAQVNQDAIKIPTISRAAHNEVFYNNYKSYVDHIYNEAVARFHGDSNKARLWMNQDEGVKHKLMQAAMVAEEWDLALNTISDIMKNKDSNNFITPTAAKMYAKILNNARGEDGKTEVDRSFKRNEKTGEVYDMDFTQTAKLLSTIQRLPSIFNATSKMAESYKNVIQGDMKQSTFGNSSNDAFEAWKSTNKDFENWTEEEIVDENGQKVKRKMPPKLDQMTDTIMGSEYSMSDVNSGEYAETRKLVRESINLQVQRMTERQYQVLSSENAKKNLLMESVGMADAEGLAYDVGGKTFTASKLKNVIGFAPDKYYQNPSTVGIRPGERLVSPNRPGVMFELMEPEKLEYSLVSQYTGEYTVDPLDYLGHPSFIQKEITKNKGKVSTGGLYTFKIPTASLNIRSIEKGSTVTTKDGRSVSQTDAYASTYKVKVYSEEFPQGKEEEWSGDISVLTSANDVNYIARQENQGFALKYAKDSQDNSSKGAWTRTEIAKLGVKSEGGVTSRGVKVKDKQNSLPEKVDFGTLGTKK